jgi:dipeptidase E
MTSLILTGGGNSVDSKPLDELFIQLINKKKILYIPVAWKSGDFDECYEWFYSTFSNLGVTDFEMWTDLYNKSLGDLKQFGGIYLGGGNTFSLLDHIKKSQFGKLLVKSIKNGIPVYGGSAGAIILGKDIEIAGLGVDSDSNDINLKDFSGFNLVNDYLIQCHYESDQDKELINFSKNSKLIALSERSGILVEDNKINVVGFESAYVFKDGVKTEFKVGSEIK